MTVPVLRVENLVKEFPIRNLFKPTEYFRAVDDVSFQVERGSVVGLVGESGSGKSTTARCVIRLTEPDSGRIYVQGEDVIDVKGAELKALRRKVQIVFQDPYASLNPRMKVEDIVSEGIRIHKLIKSPEERRARVAQLLELVGLERAHLRPARLSVLRRPTTAHRDRPGPCRGPHPPHLRRAGLIPGRVHSGADPQRVPRPAAAAASHHALHRARPGNGSTSL